MGQILVTEVISNQCNIKESLKVMLSNARSLTNKIDELRLMANIHKPQIIGVTETWGTDSIDDAFFFKKSKQGFL